MAGDQDEDRWVWTTFPFLQVQYMFCLSGWSKSVLSMPPRNTCILNSPLSTVETNRGSKGTALVLCSPLSLPYTLSETACHHKTSSPLRPGSKSQASTTVETDDAAGPERLVPNPAAIHPKFMRPRVPTSRGLDCMGVPRLGMAATPIIWDTVERLLFLGAGHMYGKGRILCRKHDVPTAPGSVV